MANWNDDSLNFNSRLQIQKIVSTPISLCLRVRANGRNVYLNVPRGGSSKSFFISNAVPPPELRIKDKFSEFVKSKVTGHDLIGLYKTNSDNALCLLFSTKIKRSFLSLFMKGNQTFFIFGESESLEGTWNCFVPWENRSISISGKCPYFELFKNLGIREHEDFGALKFENIEQNSKLEEILSKAQKPNKNLSKMTRKIESIEGDLQKINQWKKIKAAIEKFNTTGEMSQIEYYIGRKSDLTGDYQKVNYLWQKTKKLKLAEKLQKQRLTQTIEIFLLEKSKLTNLPSIHSPEWKNLKAANDKKRSTGFSEYRYEEFRIAIGNDSLENQNLRKEWAKKEDLWFHPYHKPGPHLFIKIPQGKTIDPKVMEILAGIIIDKMSGINDSEIELVYTNVKNLKPIKSNLGSVTYKNHKVIKVKADLKWREKVSPSSK
jgi:hypothetical protein